ncbi:MAG: YqaJ viral recombinase family protein [Rhodocyclaceae bacterium]
MKYGNAKRLISTRTLSRQEWLSARNAGIGSSDAAAALGLSPYKSPLELWLEKTGRRTPEDISEKDAVFWGSTLEPIIASVYAQRSEQRVHRVNALLQHPQHPFMLANLDRAAGSDGILEIKTAGHHSAHLWEDGVPDAYHCQVVHQLAVTGKAWADVAVLIGGQDFRVYRIARNEAEIAALIERESTFWRHVQSDVAPDPDGSESAGRSLSWLYPRDAGQTVDCSDSPSLNRVFQDLLSLRRQREQLEFLEATYKQTLQAAMGSATAAVFAGGKVSWKTSRDSNGTDIKRLLADHPQLARQYAITVGGSRRFLMQVGRDDKASPSGASPILPAPTTEPVEQQTATSV